MNTVLKVDLELNPTSKQMARMLMAGSDLKSRCASSTRNRFMKLRKSRLRCTFRNWLSWCGVMASRSATVLRLSSISL